MLWRMKTEIKTDAQCVKDKYTQTLFTHGINMHQIMLRSGSLTIHHYCSPSTICSHAFLTTTERVWVIRPLNLHVFSILYIYDLTKKKKELYHCDTKWAWMSKLLLFNDSKWWWWLSLKVHHINQLYGFKRCQKWIAWVI